MIFLLTIKRDPKMNKPNNIPDPFPNPTTCGSDAVMLKHRDTIYKLHQAMSMCKERFFQYPEVSMMDWKKEYLCIAGAHVDR